MSQREGQILVCVKEHALWEKLYDLEILEEYWLNARTGKEIFGNVKDNIWYIDGDWSPEFGNGFVHYSGIGNLLRVIQEKLGRENCVILASLTDINTDPFEWIFYSLGNYLEFREVRGICGGPGIRNVAAWIKWAKISLKPEELMHLAGFEETKKDAEILSPIKRLSSSSGDERHGRLFISVKDPAQWSSLAGLKLTDKTFGFPKDFAKRLSETTGYDFVWDEDWHIEYGDSNSSFPLKRVVSRLKQRLGSNDCVILADCADPDVSPVYRVACCVDGNLACREVIAPLEDASISDVRKWLRLAGFQINQKKKDYFQGFPSTVFDFVRPAGSAKRQSGNLDVNQSLQLKGLIFAVTGDVTRFKSRQELKQFIESHGGKLGSDVTPKTNYLITNTPGSGSSKNRKAQTYGIPVITEEDFVTRFKDSASAE